MGRTWYLSLLCCLWMLGLRAQGELGLQEAIGMAQQQSLDYKVAKNSYQSSRWNFESYRTSFYPMLYLNGTVPNYARTISRITLPNGEDTFVSQNQAYSSLNLGLSQSVAATGGILSLSTSLNRIDVFGNSRSVNYSAVPVSLSYSQNTIGYNAYKWLRKIEPLRLEIADREFVSGMEGISIQTVTLYFGALLAQARLSLSVRNVATADTLLRISRERFRLGTVGQSELLQLELGQLTARRQLTQDSVDLVLARQQLARFLALPEEGQWQLQLPDQEVAFFDVVYERALSLALENGREVRQFRLNRLEAEQQLVQIRAENKLKFNVQVNFGLSNQSPDITGIFRQLENQQNLSLGFSLPILDWGNAHNRRLQAEANLAMVESQIDQGRMAVEQEIALQVSRWSLHAQQLAVARQSREIAAKNYELEQQRYLNGSISLNDLNIALSSRDSSITAYYEVIRTYWELYYTLRKLTLFDFEKQESIVHYLTEIN